MRRAILIAALAISCNKLPTESAVVIPFLEIHKESRTGVKTAREELITTNERWQAVWAEIVSDRSPKPSAPQVDFTQRALVFVSRGELGDACRAVVIARTTLRNERLEVDVLDTRPPASCICPPVTVQPVHIVSIPRVAAAATYRYESATVGPGCGS